MNQNIIPIILAGGAGTRLWPLSRGQSPKQFLRLGDHLTLLHQTLLRCSGDVFDRTPIIVGSSDNRAQLLEAIQSLDLKADLILEPMRRNSCAAIVAGTLRALERDALALVLVLAADHHIPDMTAFWQAAKSATAAANAGKIVTFGIKPRHAATGYGYIMPGSTLDSHGVHKISRFVEKPDPDTATRYVADGFLWNSGNFLFHAGSFIDQVRLLEPDVLTAVALSLQAADRDIDFIRLAQEPFSRSPQISVDFAIMEKTVHAAVLPVDYFWTDLGTWDAVATTASVNSDGNAIIGRGIIENGKNIFIHSESLLTTVIGCENIVVVTTRDAVLVVKKGDAESVKSLVDRLKAEGFAESEAPLG